MPAATLRMASRQDAEALLAIYAPYIETPVTFECELPTLADFANRVDGALKKYPYLLVEEGERILGYAYAHRHLERSAYQWDADLSVYLRREDFGRGAGRALYGALMELLTMQHVQNVYGAVTGSNERSARFHRAMGFRELGTYHGTGYKCGQWLDVCWFERRLGGDAPPQSVTPVGELPPEAVADVLRRWEQGIGPRRDADGVS